MLNISLKFAQGLSSSLRQLKIQFPSDKRSFSELRIHISCRMRSLGIFFSRIYYFRIKKTVKSSYLNEVPPMYVESD